MSKMIQLLKEKNIEVDPKRVNEIAGNKEPCRPHLAQALLVKT